MAGLRGLSLSKAASERLFRYTSGHPLHVQTLLTELSPEQLASSDGALPVPHSLALATVARLRELPESARDLAEALAVINQRTSLQVAARVGAISDPSRALDSLFCHRVCRLGGSRRAQRLGPGSPPVSGRHLRPPGAQPAPAAAPGRCRGTRRPCRLGPQGGSDRHPRRRPRRGTRSVRAGGTLRRPFPCGGRIFALGCSVHFGVPAGRGQAADGRPLSPRRRADGQGRGVAAEVGGLPGQPGSQPGTRGPGLGPG